MDISVTEGCLIGVVKEHDPMDNKEKWFVDDGGSKGFIPHNILTPLNNSPWGTIGNEDEEDDIISILSGDSGDSIVLTGNDNRVESHSSNSFTDSSYQQTHQPQYQYYYALYDFQSRHSNEASLTAGHPVAVLKFHDADGRTEWWLVDSEGKRGYAPANYMAPYEAPSNNS
uniref:SH3 domain-containing protein n=1 Tax=Arion vulgaris TaxID=1028688 RepID=A0A0B7B9F0_9EUPU